MAIDLWQLLPSVQQADDAARGHPLRALLDIVSEQAELVRSDIGALWDDFFIETCADWVVPYIGELVGTTPLRPVPRGPRADVARTVHFRRRKGTLAVLDELAGFVTGWPAHAVPFFERMIWTQNMNHVRPAVTTADLRHLEALDDMGTAFDPLSHSADIRPFASTGGLYNIAKVGFFLWRLEAYTLTQAVPRQASGLAHAYHFSPLGNPAPLFAPARSTEAAGTRPELGVTGPIRRSAFHHHPLDYYPERAGVLSVAVDGRRIPPEEIQCMDLRTWARPASPGIRLGIDVERGRFSFAAGAEPADPAAVGVNFAYGFSTDLGGGPYPRPAPPNAGATADPAIELTLEGNGTHAAADLVLGTDAGRVTVRAQERHRPVVRGDLVVETSCPEQLVLDGLVLEGKLEIAAGSRLRRLVLSHCTLVPGRALDDDGAPVSPGAASLVVGPGNDELEITIDHSITGRLQIPASTPCLTVRDSILDGAGTDSTAYALAGDEDGLDPGPCTALERVTVFGRVRVRELAMASETIFTQRIDSVRRQVGCARFSYVPPESTTPPQFRCQPASAVEGLTSKPRRERELRRLIPVFTSRRYGDPAYAQLSLATATELRTGTENGAEMGVYNALLQAPREANLRDRLEEYLPVGLEPGFIYVT